MAQLKLNLLQNSEMSKHILRPSGFQMGLHPEHQNTTKMLLFFLLQSEAAATEGYRKVWFLENACLCFSK